MRSIVIAMFVIASVISTGCASTGHGSINDVVRSVAYSGNEAAALIDSVIELGTCSAPGHFWIPKVGYCLELRQAPDGFRGWGRHEGDKFAFHADERGNPLKTSLFVGGTTALVVGAITRDPKLAAAAGVGAGVITALATRGGGKEKVQQVTLPGGQQGVLLGDRVVTYPSAARTTAGPQRQDPGAVVQRPSWSCEPNSLRVENNLPHEVIGVRSLGDESLEFDWGLGESKCVQWAEGAQWKFRRKGFTVNGSRDGIMRMKFIDVCLEGDRDGVIHLRDTCTR
ncbi:MAG: hypothetical protein A3C88_01215 [Candidatus Yanofskybacteria bacterium RIFCSPHIGHO2_02_FULL_50_12]|uniref:Ricin B lectin domain-containing protein n=1 Tax=Candidatus Yanofskybacteria bacterium RIFCSPHIGHO2_02_FULL_50_12 TaxID=1802685 RepID=A0A1F8FTB5_9BACT|nr:MAG: hypothetical protein A3C88_01215 [Candidatus Yanofskybacteria bacterium RIFCSPHIGHO2_02_FULL_50_12]